eukprot:TRINITY_DN739_c0_g1_i11.p1 TRINITY_DN739_c0_g1~~TRINITY_DN739_c0_g1_i11.p1  ORF type:complete len:293 (-),score=66.12 TRINITY_DN739_c0_g1_i11:553-1431(-)
MSLRASVDIFSAMTVIMTFSPKSGALGTLIWAIIMCLFIIVVLIWYICCKKNKEQRDDLEMGRNAEFDATEDEDKPHYEENVDDDDIDQVCCGMKVAYRPLPFTKSQKTFAFCHLFWICLLLTVGLLTMYSFWHVDTYYVIDRETQLARAEMERAVGSKSIAIVYGIPGAATVLSMNRFMVALTKTCGKLYTKTLTTDKEKEEDILNPWIEPYQVDMTQFSPSDYRKYDSVNDWFIRNLTVPRPIAEIENPKVISSPADCRVMVFPNVQKDHEWWIKGSDFNMKEIIGKIMM